MNHSSLNKRYRTDIQNIFAVVDGEGAVSITLRGERMGT